MPVFTAAAVAIAAFIGVESVIGLAVINFAVRAVATVVITSLLTRKLDPGSNPAGASAPSGSRVQLPPATNNKLPVVYGNAFMSPTIIDAKISTDQQYMWYVMALSEVTDTGTITYDDPSNAGYPLCYWGDKQMIFGNGSTRYVVTGLKDPSSGAIDTAVSGNMEVYFYRDGSSTGLYGAPSAITVLTDDSTGGGIPVDQRWDNNKTMSKVAFCIIRVKYNQDANLTGLQQVTAYVRNSLYLPGSVMVDYLANERYGCGVPLGKINVAAFTGTDGLNDYSIEEIAYSDNGVVKYQPRYKINGPIDTTRNCLDNLIQLSEACDSWMQWNEQIGKWSVIVNRPYDWNDIQEVTDLFTIYCDTVIADTHGTAKTNNHGYAIGGVDITPLDLNATPNKVEVQFPNKLIKDQTDYAYINTPPELINPNEPINKLIMQLPQVNDDVQAQYLANRKLEQARDDLIVTVTTDYGGIQVDAGDVIRIYHSMYGWSDAAGFPYGKLFRVTQVQETKDDDGNLGARINLAEYNAQVYDNYDITSFQPAANTGITDPTVISTPALPTVSDANTSASIPTFVVTATVPAVGQVTALEYWYALASSPPVDASTFRLFQTQYYSGGPVYPNGYSQTITVSGLPASTGGLQYYWRIRAAGNRSKSGYSNNSTSFSWSPNPSTTVTGQTFQATFQPSPVTVNRYANGQPDLANVSIKLYGLVGAGQINFVMADSNANANFTNNTWRIDQASIIKNGLTIGNATDGGNYAQWPAPSALGSNVATLTVPVYYKDITGNIYAAPPSVLNINTLLPGADGSRGVVPLAYVQVNYDPTYGVATDVQLNGSFFSTTGFNPPINNDGAVFFNEGTNIASARVYDSTATPYKWKSATLQVPGQTISSNSITGNQIVGNTITGSKIVGNTITGNLIQATTITGNKLAANTILANNIASDSIITRHLTANSITSDKIGANEITTDKLIANVITTNKINALAITTDKLDANSVTSAKIAAGSITTDKLAANFVYAGNIASFNSTFGSNTSDGFWFDGPNGVGHFGNSLSVGLLIESSQLRANTVTAENLVIGSVTQSRSTISDPKIALMPYYNWPVGTSDPAWPDNTRGIVPPSGVTIVPTTDPTSSANTEYTEGSRITIGISAKVYSNSNPEYNLIEVWKSGAGSYYSQGYNSVRHSYDLTQSGTASQTIHAYGFGGLDLYSSDGGQSWTNYNASTADRVITGAISFYYTWYGSTGFGTQVVGPLQRTSSGSSGTPTVNWGSRNQASPIPPANRPIQFYYTTYVPGDSLYNYTSWQDMCVAPYTGGPGVYGSGSPSTMSGALICGYQGTIFYAPGGGSGPSPSSLIAPYNTWIREPTGGTLQSLNGIYAGRTDDSGAKNYTAVCVGDTGTILVSTRTWAITNYSWFPKTIHKYGTSDDLLTDLYDVASDDSQYASSTKWVAVGQYGTIVYSLDNGVTWAQADTSTIPNNLNCVRYGNGKWVVAGDAGVILTSTNATTWTQINSTLTEKNLLTVDYSFVHSRFNIGGQDGIYTSPGSSLDFVLASGTSVSPTRNYNLTRIGYWGSNPNVFDSTIPAVEQRLINGQTLSATIIDTQYSANVPVTYYLVVGNFSNGYKDVYIGQMFINATEIKR